MTAMVGTILCVLEQIIDKLKMTMPASVVGVHKVAA